MFIKRHSVLPLQDCPASIRGTGVLGARKLQRPYTRRITLKVGWGIAWAAGVPVWGVAGPDEPGLYWFLGRSDKPKALPFQKWIYGEVLPSIRKTGGYDLRLNMDEVKQIVRLPEPYKRDAFRRLLAQAGKHNDKSEGTRLMLNICCIFAAAETGSPLDQARLTI